MESPIENNTNDQPITTKQKFEGKVLKTTLQGAIVDIGSKLPAFLHVSQVVDSANPDKIITNLEQILKEGQEVTVWVRRIVKDHYELTMHEPLLYEWRELAPDMNVKGTVIRMETFGAFVEIGAEQRTQRPFMLVHQLTTGEVVMLQALDELAAEVEQGSRVDG